MPLSPNTEALDERLEDMVQALHRTVNFAMPHTKDPKVADKAIQDCKEILDVVMKGKVSEWLES